LFADLEDPEKEAMLFETPTDNFLSLDNLNKKLFYSRPKSATSSQKSAETREKPENISHSNITDMGISD
jgi:hypothetical protein